MSSLNNVSVQGRLSCNPELRRNQNGKSYCSISIFLENMFPTQDNPGGFIDIILFDKKADFVAKYFSKGDQVIINGNLKHDSWVDKKTNSERSRWSIVAENVYFCGKRMTEQKGGEQDCSENHQNNYQQPRYQQPKQPAYMNNNYQNQNQNQQQWQRQNSFDDEAPF